MNLEQLFLKAERFVEKNFDANFVHYQFDDEIEYSYYEGNYKVKDAFIDAVKKEHIVKIVITITTDKRDEGSVWIELVPFIKDIDKKLFNLGDKDEDLHYFRLEPNEENEFDLSNLELESY